MINFIKGILIENNIIDCVVEVNGIGYNIFIPKNILLPEIGEEVFLYTYFSVKEDSMQLFGFTEKQDKQIFLKLLSVNGVGPKNALTIISDLGCVNLVKAIINEDKKTISSIKGVGEKTAARIIIDLKDKIKLENFVLSDISINILKQNNNLQNEKINNVIEALGTLGYQKTKIKNIINEINIDLELSEEDILKIILKSL